MWSLMFAFIYILWFLKPKILAIPLLILFVIFAYFLGSKGFIIKFFIVFVFYWHFLFKPIKSLTLVFIGLVVIASFLFIQLLQNTANNFLDTIKYFIYFNSTARFLSVFDQVGFQYGTAYISQFWEMVPRSLYSDKPYVYGQYIIHETLDPGQLKKGRAVGILKWTRYYLDFGVLGVILTGFITGIFNKAFFHYFLQNKENPFAFMIMIQFGIIPIFNYSTIPIFIALIIIFSFFLRSFGSFKLRRYFILQY
jgi:hypothetical protein